MNEDIKALCVRLETVANESEIGLNFAGTPQICRQAVLAINGQSLRINELKTMNKSLCEGMGKVDALLSVADAVCQSTHDAIHKTAQISTYGAIDMGYEPTGEAQ